MVREDTHKKEFLVVGPLRFYPSYTNGSFFSLFFSLIIAWNGFWHFFLFLPNFWAKTAGFDREKKWFFAKWSGEFTLPTLLVVRPLNFFFLCVSSLKYWEFQHQLLFSVSVRKHRILNYSLLHNITRVFSVPYIE